ncbi:MAG TPA: MEDS domain-containing protein [Streptosporangiaceae bacterium]|nr:MEDS domain-containing protein [Streptosporangiaceae bacterium]
MPDDRHPSADDLADLMAGALEHGQAAAIQAHVAACAACSEVSSQLEGLPGLLAGARYPAMPEGASLRIEAALIVAASRRASGRDSASDREGVVDSAAGVDPFGHLCWAYRGKADWADHAVEFSADGIAAGQCIKLIGDASTEDLRSELAERVRSMAEGRAADRDLVEVRDLTDYHRFGSDGIIDTDATIAAHHAVLESALAAGYAGIRFAVEETAIARTAAQRDAAVRMEFRGGRAASSLPAGSMCGYDVDELGADAVAELACVHPFIRRGAAPFRLYAVDDADFGLAGTIDDVTAQGLFRTTLGRTMPPEGSELVVDARHAEFIADGALAELNAHAARMGRTAVVHTRTSTLPSPARRPALSCLTIDTGDSP